METARSHMEPNHRKRVCSISVIDFLGQKLLDRVVLVI